MPKEKSKKNLHQSASVVVSQHDFDVNEWFRHMQKLVELKRSKDDRKNRRRFSIFIMSADFFAKSKEMVSALSPDQRDKTLRLMSALRLVVDYDLGLAKAADLKKEAKWLANFFYRGKDDFDDCMDDIADARNNAEKLAGVITNIVINLHVSIFHNSPASAGFCEKCPVKHSCLANCSAIEDIFPRRIDMLMFANGIASFVSDKRIPDFCREIFDLANDSVRELADPPDDEDDYAWVLSAASYGYSCAEFEMACLIRAGIVNMEEVSSFLDEDELRKIMVMPETDEFVHLFLTDESMGQPLG